KAGTEHLLLAEPPAMRALLSFLMGLSLLAPSPSTPGIVAIGDIHGDLDALTRSLRAAGLTDASGRWIAGRTVLVQTGDFLDRGPDVRGVMDRVMPPGTEGGG